MSIREIDERVQAFLERPLDGEWPYLWLDATYLKVCEVGQIARSLVFRGAETGQGVLAIVAGNRRVHEKRLGRQIGEALERATPDFVREATGFAIGGVPPLADLPLKVLDETLAAEPRVFAAAGTPRCVFETSGPELVRLTRAKVLDPS